MKIYKFNEKHNVPVVPSLSITPYLKSIFGIITDFGIEYFPNGQLTIKTTPPTANDYKSCDAMIKYYDSMKQLWVDIDTIINQIEDDGYDVRFAQLYEEIGISVTKDRDERSKGFSSNLFVEFYGLYEQDFSINVDILKEYCEMMNMDYISYYVTKKYNTWEINILVKNINRDCRKSLNQIDNCLDTSFTHQTNTQTTTISIEIGEEGNSLSSSEFNYKQKD